MSAAAPRPEDHAAEVARLAALDAIEYDRERKTAAKRLGIRTATLDQEVAAARAPAAASAPADIFPAEEPWPEPVDGRELVEDLRATFRRHVVLPPHADTAAALWMILSYVFDCFAVLALLVLQSPTKRCGKTTALAVLAALCHRALPASNVSGAAVFRCIEAWRPCLLIDEADTFMRDDDALRGVINSGHTRVAAYVLRCDGEANEPRRFSTWCPKVLAGIGRLRDTLEDRAIIIRLERKHPNERTERLRQNDPHLAELRAKMLRWAADHRAKLAAAEPETPAGLNDRAADNWTPLLAIADACGLGDEARAAALALSGADDTDGDGLAVQLLADIRDIFKVTKAVRISSANLCKHLAAMEERPWPEYRHGKPITPRQLAALLRNFGIRPKTLRTDDERLKGYELTAFADAFSRYLPATPLPIRDTVTSQQNQEVTAISKRDENEGVTDKKSRNPLKNKVCHGVTDKNPPSGAEEKMPGLFAGEGVL